MARISSFRSETAASLVRGAVKNGAGTASGGQTAKAGSQTAKASGESVFADLISSTLDHMPTGQALQEDPRSQAPEEGKKSVSEATPAKDHVGIKKHVDINQHKDGAKNGQASVPEMPVLPSSNVLPELSASRVSVSRAAHRAESLTVVSSGGRSSRYQDSAPVLPDLAGTVPAELKATAEGTGNRQLDSGSVKGQSSSSFAETPLTELAPMPWSGASSGGANLLAQSSELDLSGHKAPLTNNDVQVLSSSAEAKPVEKAVAGRIKEAAGSIAKDPSVPVPGQSVAGSTVASWQIGEMGTSSAEASQLAQVPVSQLPAIVRHMAQAGPRRMELMLDPPQLGRIDVQVETSAQGIKVSIQVADNQTLALIHRHLAELGESISFDMGKQGGREREQPGQAKKGNMQEMIFKPLVDEEGGVVL